MLNGRGAGDEKEGEVMKRWKAVEVVRRQGKGSSRVMERDGETL
jgi:hypothetical protein